MMAQMFCHVTKMDQSQNAKCLNPTGGTIADNTDICRITLQFSVQNGSTQRLTLDPHHIPKNTRLTELTLQILSLSF